MNTSTTAAPIDTLQNLKNWAEAEPTKTIHDASEVAKRLAGLSDKPLAGNVHVPANDLHILLGIDSLERKQLQSAGVIPEPEFSYYGRWSVKQVREIIANGIERLE